MDEFPLHFYNACYALPNPFQCISRRTTPSSWWLGPLGLCPSLWVAVVLSVTEEQLQNDSGCVYLTLLAPPSPWGSVVRIPTGSVRLAPLCICFFCARTFCVAIRFQACPRNLVLGASDVFAIFGAGIYWLTAFHSVCYSWGSSYNRWNLWTRTFWILTLDLSSNFGLGWLPYNTYMAEDRAGSSQIISSLGQRTLCHSVSTNTEGYTM